ncbi:MAG TPA: hypothetical protein H9837_01510 [Candidatus Brachybacterium merdigallinarum]|nr:hypothetical protein [Candidatus Brachybacterium merdigallinarum]
MTPPDPFQQELRNRPRSIGRVRSLLGIPVPVIAAALLLSGLLGLQLASALETSTSSRIHTSATVGDGSSGAGMNEAGIPVITESTLGIEVQRLVDTGTIQSMTSFDASQCLRKQGITDTILIMEEVAWGPEETPGWLIVHGPVDRETLRAAGGTVSTTVVQPTCGTDDSTTVDQERLWSGDVMIGSI